MCYSRACAIEDGSSVVITGGYYSLRTVSRYSVQGWQEDLGQLITGRYGHGCSAYFKGNSRVKHILILILYHSF